jgi:hypothetical protein
VAGRLPPGGARGQWLKGGLEGRAGGRLPVARDALTASCSCELLVRPATVPVAAPVHGVPPFPSRRASPPFTARPPSLHGAPPFPSRRAPLPFTARPPSLHGALLAHAVSPAAPAPPRRQELSPLLQGDARAARWLRERTEPVSHLVVQDGGDKGRRRRIRAMQEQSAKQAEMSTLSHRDFDIKGDFKG